MYEVCMRQGVRGGLWDPSSEPGGWLTFIPQRGD